MRRIAISVAALTAMGFLATAAQAEVIAGQANTKAGQVWKFSPHQEYRDQRFGIWVPAPAPAAVAVSHRAHRRSSR